MKGIKDARGIVRFEKYWIGLGSDFLFLYFLILGVNYFALTCNYNFTKYVK